MKDEIFEYLKDTNGTFTTIFGALGGLLMYVLWGAGILAQPQYPLLIYAFGFTFFSGIGGAIDYYQSKYL